MTAGKALETGDILEILTEHLSDDQMTLNADDVRSTTGPFTCLSCGVTTSSLRDLPCGH